MPRFRVIDHCFLLRQGATKAKIKLLLEEGFDPNGCSEHVSTLECASQLFGESPLIEEGVLQLLFDAGADLLKVGKNGRSPLRFVLQAGAGAKDIEWLLGKGAKVNACEYHKCVYGCVLQIIGRYV